MRVTDARSQLLQKIKPWPTIVGSEMICTFAVENIQLNKNDFMSITE